MRVLLTDTDEVFLEAAQSFLWDHGHEAEVAANGLECISILREFVPDVFVIDRDLLWGGGDGILNQIQADLLLSQIPVILAAVGDLDDELVAKSGLLVAYLAKPYRLGELLYHINQAGRTEPIPLLLS